MANKVGLTDARIAGLKAPATGQIELADRIVTGLRLRMGASGIKTYILRKRVQGKWLNVTIGRHGPSFTLANARRKARDLLVDVEQGKNIARKPGAKRKGSKGVGTVAELYEIYLSQQIEGKKRSAKEFDRVFRKYIEPELGDRLADSITRSDVSRFVEKIAFERGKETLTMARIVYRHLSTFYTWALTRLEHLPANPCRDAWRPKRSEPRDRVLSDRELAALWQAAVEDGYPFGHLVQMLVLTAQRRGEVLDATCDEFDFKAKVWTVPGDRAKNGKANVVPLSAQALAVVTDIFAAAGIAPDDAHKQSQILLASKVTNTNSVSGLSKAWKRIRAKDGAVSKRRVILTDGGVYDNLGLAPLWPDRDDSISFHVSQYSRIVACRAGYGLEAAPAPSLAAARLTAAFESIFARAQNFGIKRLFDLKATGALDDFLHPYLGQKDERLACAPSDLIQDAERKKHPASR